VEHVPLDAIAADATFRLREVGDVSGLATAIGRLGQLEPLDLRPMPAPDGEGKGYQVVRGFRRLEALRLLQRERVLARVHEGLPDADAWALALAGPLFGEAWGPAELEALAPAVKRWLPWAEPVLAAARKRAAGGKAAPAPAAATPVPAAAAPAAAPASPAPAAPPPADPSAFARRLAVRTYELNGEMAVAYERWNALPAEGRRLVLEQLRYLFRLYPLLDKENR
jgi:ParB-like chromosome segregation protein Spo0J